MVTCITVILLIIHYKITDGFVVQTKAGYVLVYKRRGDDSGEGSILNGVSNGNSSDNEMDVN